MTATTTDDTQAALQGRALPRERADLLHALNGHRFFLRFTAQGLTDEQAGVRSTVSELCIGGLIKHVAAMEDVWARFTVEGPAAIGDWDADSWGDAEIAARAAEFEMREGETISSVLAEYEQVAARTDALVAALPDLDQDHPLPQAPWFEPGARWSNRRALLHIIAETAQHAGHADIIREAIDGAKTMG